MLISWHDVLLIVDLYAHSSLTALIYILDPPTVVCWHLLDAVCVS